nr:hypothetical protein [Tanacetum cinerariifolium]
MAFMSSPSRTNEVNTAYGVSTAITQVSPISTQDTLEGVAIDGVGFDWSYIADDEVPTNMAFVAFLDFEPEFGGYGPKTSNNVSEDIYNEVKESPDAPLNKKLVSDDNLKKKTVSSTIAKREFVRPKQQEKPVRKPVKYAKMYRNLMEDMLPLGEEPNEEKLLMCDKKNSVLFTDTGCFVLSPDFKLAYESQVLLKIPRKNNMYSVDMKNIVLKESLTCLVANAKLDESLLWHRWLATKDETSGILKSFITKIENLVDKTIKIIRRDNETEFKNRVISERCEKKVIKKEFSVARTLQQNGVAEKRNRTIIEAAKTMVLVVKPHNQTPYELFKGRTPALSFMRPFKCHVTILNTLDHLVKFDGKSYDGFFVGYSLNNALTKSMNYVPVVADGLLFDSSSKNANNDEPQPSSDARKKNDDVTKESGINDQERHENSTQDVNTAGPSINTVSTNVNIGSLNINIVSLSVTTTPLEATHVDLFGDETETMRMTKTTSEQGFISAVYEGKTHKDLHTCLFACFLSQEEPKKVWTLVDLAYNKRAIRTKWIYINKKDERGIVVRNKARLVAQGHTQEEGIDCDEVFALVARIEAIRLFLAYASFKDFVVYQIDVKSAFMYGKIKKEVYVCQPSGFEDPEFPGRLYKVEKALYGLHQAPKAWVTRKELCTEFEKIMRKKFQISSIGELTFFLRLQVTQKDDGIFISQDKYVDEILKMFGFSTVETSNPLLKDAEAEDESSFDLEAYTDSDYAGASLGRKSTIGGCQFLGSRLNLWQCKKQAMVANSTTEAEYVATASKLTTAVDVNTLCIKQFWATAKVNTINGEVQIQTLVDMKKVIIIDTSVKSDLQLEDDEGTECLPNATIFKQLTLMGYENVTQKITLYKAFFSPQWKILVHIILQCLSAKTTTWNEFSSTMASAIICLATNQKFNFSKYIFNNMVKNLEGGVKFLMFLTFVQVFLDKQVEGMFKHKEIYVTPSHTKKVFANMKRHGKDFSGIVTPLFLTMLVEAQQKRKQKTKKPRRKDTELPHTSVPTEVIADEAVYEEMYDSVERAATTTTGLDAKHDRGIINHGDAAAKTRSERVSKFYNDPPLSRVNTLGSGDDRLKLSELMKLCNQLQSRVLALETINTYQALEIKSLKRRVKKLKKKASKRTHKLKRLYKIGSSRRIESSVEASLGDQEDASKHRRIINNLDDDEGVTLVSTADPDITPGEVVTTVGVEVSTAATTPTISMDDIILAKALAALKSAKPMVKEPSVSKAKRIVTQDPKETTIRITTVPSQSLKDKDKAKMIEPEKPLKKKDHIMIDEEVARNLEAQAKLEEK